MDAVVLRPAVIGRQPKEAGALHAVLCERPGRPWERWGNPYTRLRSLTVKVGMKID